MSELDPYTCTIRQCAHDAVRAVLAAPVDSLDGSTALRGVVGWLAAEYGAAGVRDLAEELAVDLAEAIAAIATVEQHEPLEVVDAWFHDAPIPATPDPVDHEPVC